MDKQYVIKSNKQYAIKNDSKTAHNKTLEILKYRGSAAQKEFDKQMAKDGWAADVADGVSNIWGVFQDNGNQAWKVRKDLKAHNKNIAELQKAASQGEAKFNAKFKEIFGKDFNQNALAEYVKNPTEQNYEKVFGTKNNIQKRVKNYNNSQDTGAQVVKTTATATSGVVIGVATGGTGLAAMGVAAAATAGASAAINVSDRLSSNEGLKEGVLKEIAKNAAWDGTSVLAGGLVGKAAGTLIRGASKSAAVARAAVNTTGDVTVGAAQEYIETGSVSAEGTLTNAALGSIGIASEAGAFKKVKEVVKKAVHNKSSSNVSANNSMHTSNSSTSNVKNKSSTADINSSIPPQQFNEEGMPIAGGLFGKTSFTDKFFGKKSNTLSDKQIKDKVKKNITRAEGDNVHMSKNWNNPLTLILH